MSRIGLAMIALFAIGNSGCTLAHYIYRQPDYGVVAIPSNTNSWPFYYRDRAIELIRKHVGPDYVIVKEQTVVTGGNVGLDQTTPRGTPASVEDPSDLIQEKVASGDMMGAHVAEVHITYARRGAIIPGVTIPALPPPEPAVQPPAASPLPPPRQLPTELPPPRPLPNP
jgi:hypothetical protein